MTPWIAAMMAALVMAPAHGQNLDAGKSPAQIYGEVCATCHRSGREFKNPSASFLREHYTTGPDMASSLARYLASIGSDSRGAQKRQGGAAARETSPAAARESTPAET